MNSMDSLHLFTIPKWLPANIPPEIWAIIFHWKWRLEMKDINTKLIVEMEARNIIIICHKEYCNFVHDWVITGNKYNMYNIELKGGNKGVKYINIVPKCGIKFIDTNFYPIQNFSAPFLHKYITENLGLKCSETLEWKDMIKLLRTV